MLLFLPIPRSRKRVNSVSKVPDCLFLFRRPWANSLARTRDVKLAGNKSVLCGFIRYYHINLLMWKQNLLVIRQKVLAGSSYRISTESWAFFPLLFVSFLLHLFLLASIFYFISVLSASSLASFFFILFLTRQKMQTNPDHSHLFPYRISDVEVFDYQLAGFRSEFIRPSFLRVT